MGRLDEFIARQVHPELAAGEPITGTAAVYRPLKVNVFRVPTHYEAFFVAVTPARLFLIKTEVSLLGIFSAPKECNRGVSWFGLDELAEVDLDAVAGVGGGRALRLRFLPGSGPPYAREGWARYDAFPSASQLDGQRMFYDQFGGWLKAQVAAGAFPRRPEVEARAQAAAHAQAQEEARRRQVAALQAQRRAETFAAVDRFLRELARLAQRALKASLALGGSAQFKRWFLRLALPALPLLFTAVSLIELSDAVFSLPSSEAHLQSASTAASRAFWQRHRDELNETIWFKSAAGALGGLVTVAALGAGLLLTRRRPAPGAPNASPPFASPAGPARAAWHPPTG